ncbi:CSG1/SUR1-like protein [Paecilomyces lecythidis]|uniref:CSG1/SUR1-like protein n=1 Tax=Paecilomyces lecythidis TaxID=3004212 RepID=A0ABR3WX05_9EURO
MRRGLLIFLLINLLILFFLVRSVSTLLSLLVEDATADAIHFSPNSSLIEQRPQIIPKIIHQTYKNETIPEVWADAQQSCIDLHPDYEYMLWTDEKSRDFIAAEYPWFLKTFDGYTYPIQRADSIRYFILAHYGGTYIDLDDGCNRRLDPLLAYPAWVRRTVPTGISNDAMGSVPGHPFFQRVIESLQHYDHHWLLPYITVMYSTGPLFLSVIWKEYMQDSPSEMNRVRVLMPDEYKKHSWSFFTHHTGNSWHGKDARLIFWMGEHWMLLTFCGFLLAAVVGLCLFWVYSRIVDHRYIEIPSAIRMNSLSSSPSRVARDRMPMLLRTVNLKGDQDIEISLEHGFRED